VQRDDHESPQAVQRPSRTEQRRSDAGVQRRFLDRGASGFVPRHDLEVVMLTCDRLRELFHYEPETGIFTRLVRTSNQTHAGDVVGAIDSHGHVQISIDSRLYLAHRLAWLYMKGVWPENQIDHKNLIRHDNRFSNLREASNGQNIQNQPKRKSNKSGHKNVYWFAPHKKWSVQISANGKKNFLGYFNDLEEAAKVAKEAREKLHGEYCNHG
jgi:hypothetical protein